ncbi:MAG TPA: hypothetical protein VER39_04725 [Nocardioidaceae bacterium]|nr:hypothetical protein [Nocardioidaceae bacterium]
MLLTRGIRELIEAIPDRIEVSGRNPVWRVTGGSFESAVAFAEQAFENPVVVSREDRSRWWPRVTVTVTTDPVMAAAAPPFELLARLRPEPEVVPELEPASAVDRQEPETTLESMFAYQEQARRCTIPQQRRPRGASDS